MAFCAAKARLYLDGIAPDIKTLVVNSLAQMFVQLIVDLARVCPLHTHRACAFSARPARSPLLEPAVPTSGGGPAAGKRSICRPTTLAEAMTIDRRTRAGTDQPDI